MAIASIDTLLPLDQYADILGLNPFHFNGITSLAHPETSACRSVWLKYSYMYQDQAGREELARAIAQAEVLIAGRTGFWPAPKLTESEDHLYPRQRRVSDGAGLMWFPSYVPQRHKTVCAKWGYFIRGGRRKVDEVLAPSTVVYSDPDGDGFDELATITVPASALTALIASVEEVAVYASANTSPQNRIKNLDVSIAAGVVTITGSSAYFARPLLWGRAEAIDGDKLATTWTLNTAYSTSDWVIPSVPVAGWVYECTVAGTSAGAEPAWPVAAGGVVADGTVTWTCRVGVADLVTPVYRMTEVNVYREWVCSDSNTYAPAAFGWQQLNSPIILSSYGILQMWSPDEGIATPFSANWDAATSTWVVNPFALSNEPHLTRLWYQSGWESGGQGRMSEPFARAVAALATALLTKPICGCGSAERLSGYWQQIPANPEAIWTTYNQLDCPFGPQNGAWEAFKVCTSYVGVDGFSL